MPQFIWTSV